MNFGAITACPMGLAHTFMAAEALEVAAKKYGHLIKIETRGALGTENELTYDELIKLDALIIASDINIDKSKFEKLNLKIIEVSTYDAINNSENIIKNAEKIITEKNENDNIEINDADNSEINIKPKILKAIYKNIMSGINIIVPFLTAAGVIYCTYSITDYKMDLNSLIYYMYPLMLAALAGYIAYSIGDKQALFSGMICGFFAGYARIGFLCTVFLGFLCGYIVFLVKKLIKLPLEYKVIVSNIVLPAIAAYLGILVVKLLNPVFLIITNSVIVNMSYFNIIESIIFGIILGFMMSYDMGGFVNKIAYILGIAELIHGPSKIMAAVMAAGMIPPIAIGIYCVIFSKGKERKKKGLRAVILGLLFVTEGAAPIVSENPKKIIPSLMAGSMAVAAASLIFKCKIVFPLGGVLVMYIPYAVNSALYYTLIIAAGILISVISLLILNIKELRN